MTVSLVTSTFSLQQPNWLPPKAVVVLSTLEISPKNINKVVEATEAIEGDVARNLASFIPLVEVSKPSRVDGQD